MDKQFTHHKLTVIFYADVAGYSRLTRRDESGTHKRVMDALDFASDAIEQGDGNVLRYAGDAILAEFQSVLKAVQAAIDIQTKLEKRNALLAVDDRVQLRVGLNIGEVMQERYDEALDCSHRSQQYPITATWAHMAELATFGTLGRHEEAGQALARALQVQPDLNITFIRQALPITHAANAKHFYGGLIKAGVPE